MRGELKGVKIKEERGAALITSLILLIILLLLGTTLSTITLFNRRANHYEMLRLEAYYLAYSGATLTAGWIKNTLQTMLPAEAKTEVMRIISTEHNPVSADHELSNGSFEVWVTLAEEAERDLYTVYAEGIVKNVTEVYVVEVSWDHVYTLPDIQDAGSLFPHTPDEFVEGTKPIGNEPAAWVDIGSGQDGTGRVALGEHNSSVPVKFDASITVVVHQEGSDHSVPKTEFKAPALYFQNTSKSLSVKGTNSIHLATDIIVFLGDIELEISGNDSGTIFFHTYNNERGKVYFYGNVYGKKGNEERLIIEAGKAFYFSDGCKIEGLMQAVPSCMTILPGGADLIHGQ